MQLFKSGVFVNVMGRKNFWLTVSGLVCLAATATLVVIGLNFGTDFRGGTELELAFKKPVTERDIVGAAVSIGFSAPDVIHVDDGENPYRYMLRVQDVTAIDDELLAKVQNALCYSPESENPLPADRCPAANQPSEFKVSPGGDKISLRYDNDPDLDGITAQIGTVAGVELRTGVKNPQIVSERDQKVDILLKSKGDQLLDGLRKTLGQDVVPDEPLRVEWIGPKAGKLLRDAAFKSIAISLFFIMFYIAIRFDLRFAPGAVVSLAHNLLFVLGIYVLFGFEFTLMSVACMLTLLGYSINDTVVVYDRIRENLGKYRGKSFADIINISVSETLSRTILTGLTTVLVMVAYLVLARGAIWYFALTFIIGVLISPYGSIFVACPVTEFFDRRVFASMTKPAGSKLQIRKRETAVV